MNIIQKVVITMVLTGTIIASAQEEFMPPMDPGRMEQMEALRIWKMTEFLDLNPDQSAQFFPLLKQHEKLIRENQDKQRGMMAEIYEMVNNKDTRINSADVKKYAKKLAELEKDIVNQKESFILSLGDVLTENQQMKFIVFENRFRNRLMRSLYQPHGPERPHKRKDNE